MQTTINRIWQSRQTSTSLALVIIGAELAAADFPPQAHGYLPPSIRDTGKAKAECGDNSFPPQAQAYLPCQRSSR